jgi:hypothetical protein
VTEPLPIFGSRGSSEDESSGSGAGPAASLGSGPLGSLPTGVGAAVPRRVVVTSPRTEAARQAKPTPRRRLDELADQTPIGDVLIRELMWAQLGLGLRVLAVLVALLAGTPLLFALVPGAGRAEVGGIAVPWLLLSGAAFPLLVLLGVVYVRQAERNEREFAELVERQP